MNKETRLKRKETLMEFIVNNKTLCYRAFKQGIEHKYYKTNYGQKLVDLARLKVPYSDKTWDGDIYRLLWRYYEMIVIEGIDID